MSRNFRVHAAERPPEGGDRTTFRSTFIHLIDLRGEHAARFLAQAPAEDMIAGPRDRLAAGAEPS